MVLLIIKTPDYSMMATMPTSVTSSCCIYDCDDVNDNGYPSQRKMGIV